MDIANSRKRSQDHGQLEMTSVAESRSMRPRRLTKDCLTLVKPVVRDADALVVLYQTNAARSSSSSTMRKSIIV